MNIYRVVFVKAPSYRKIFTEFVQAPDKRGAKIALQRREGKQRIQILSIERL